MKLSTGLLIAFILALAWMGGHAADVKRAEREGRHCGIFVC